MRRSFPHRLPRPVPSSPAHPLTRWLVRARVRYDQLLNLVLDEAEERLRDAGVRKLGLMVCRGNSVMVVLPADGTEAIENPFLTNEAMI